MFKVSELVVEATVLFYLLSFNQFLSYSCDLKFLLTNNMTFSDNICEKILFATQCKTTDSTPYCRVYRECHSSDTGATLLL